MFASIFFHSEKSDFLYILRQIKWNASFYVAKPLFSHIFFSIRIATYFSHKILEIAVKNSEINPLLQETHFKSTFGKYLPGVEYLPILRLDWWPTLQLMHLVTAASQVWHAVGWNRVWY